MNKSLSIYQSTWVHFYFMVLYKCPVLYVELYHYHFLPIIPVTCVADYGNSRHYAAEYERPIIADILSENILITLKITIYPSKFLMTFF